ncbi:MAG TPA: hypothetical protein VIM53_04520 [Candidatus Saccharimonadales bacterium]
MASDPSGKTSNKKLKPSTKKTPALAQLQASTNITTGGGSFTSTAAAGTADLEKKLNDLAKVVDKHHGEQHSIMVGVLIASVLIVATVAVEVIIFNADFKNSLDAVQQQQFDDYKTLQTNIQNEQGSLNQEILNLKIAQSQ